MTTKPYNGARRAMKRNRKMACGGSTSDPRWANPGAAGTLGSHRIRVFHVDPETASVIGKPERYAVIGTRSTFYSPTHRIALAITEALDPMYAPSRCKTLSEMSSEEKTALAAKYGATVLPDAIKIAA